MNARSGASSVRAAAGSAIKGTVKAGARAFDRARPPVPGVTILIYHRVGAGSAGEMDLSPAAFDEQLRWLKEHRTVVSIDEALHRLATPVALVGDEVVITFDDGTADWVTEVLPALARHQLPATFYVATSFLDADESVLGAPALTTQGLVELARSELVTIGSHTHGHLLLDRIDEPKLDDELERSIELLAAHTGSKPQHFAYPKAVAGSPAAQRAVRERFRSAVVAGTRPNPAGSHPHLLCRSPIQASDGMRSFRAKATGGMRAEDDLRRLANRLRYRGLES